MPAMASLLTHRSTRTILRLWPTVLRVVPPGPWTQRIVLALLLVVSFQGLRAATADSAAGPEPWQWSTEQRLALRFGPEFSQQDDLESAEHERRQGSDLKGGYVIDGRGNPELFLPWELFNELISKAFSYDPEARRLFREDIERNVVSIYLPEGFWARLEEVASEFIQSRLSQSSLGQRLREATATERAGILARIDKLQRHDCSRRHQALQGAEREFGMEFFLCFLYEGVAPGAVLAGPATLDRRSELLFVQEGCR